MTCTKTITDANALSHLLNALPEQDCVLQPSLEAMEVDCDARERKVSVCGTMMGAKPTVGVSLNPGITSLGYKYGVSFGGFMFQIRFFCIQYSSLKRYSKDDYGVPG